MNLSAFGAGVGVCLCEHHNTSSPASPLLAVWLTAYHQKSISILCMMLFLLSQAGTGALMLTFASLSSTCHNALCGLLSSSEAFLCLSCQD